MYECISRKEAQRLERKDDHLQISLSAIRLGNHRRLNRKKIEKIIEHLKRGDRTKPIVISQMHDCKYHIVGDGRHRLTAHTELKLSHIFCRVVSK